MTSYTITIKTGDMDNAGTSARVYIQLIGARTSPDIELETPNHNDFKRGQTDVFHVTTDDVGWLDAVRLHHDNRRDHPGWYVEHVRVRNDDLGLEWEVPFAQWLAKKGGEDTTDVTREVHAHAKIAIEGELCMRYVSFRILARHEASPTSESHQIFTRWEFERRAVVSSARVIATGQPLGPEFFSAYGSLDRAVARARCGAPEGYKGLVHTGQCLYEIPPGCRATIIMMIFALAETITGSCNGISFTAGLERWRVPTVFGWGGVMFVPAAQIIVDRVLTVLAGPDAATSTILRAPYADRPDAVVEAAQSIEQQWRSRTEAAGLNSDVTTTPWVLGVPIAGGC